MSLCRVTKEPSAVFVCVDCRQRRQRRWMNDDNNKKMLIYNSNLHRPCAWRCLEREWAGSMQRNELSGEQDDWFCFVSYLRASALQLDSCDMIETQTRKLPDQMDSFVLAIVHVPFKRAVVELWHKRLFVLNFPVNLQLKIYEEKSEKCKESSHK